MVEGHGTSYGGERGKEKTYPEEDRGRFGSLSIYPAEYELYENVFWLLQNVRLFILTVYPPRWEDEKQNIRGAILFNFDIENSFHESLVSEQTKNRTVREERGSWLQLETLMFSRRGDPILYISRDIVERFYLADEIGNVRCSIACALNNIGCWIFSPWRGSGTEIRVIDRPAFPLNLNNGGINLPSSRLINPQNLNSRPRQASDATDSFFTSSSFSFFWRERGNFHE